MTTIMNEVSNSMLKEDFNQIQLSLTNEIKDKVEL